MLVSCKDGVIVDVWGVILNVGVGVVGLEAEVASFDCVFKSTEIFCLVLSKSIAFVSNDGVIGAVLIFVSSEIVELVVL